MLPGMQTAVQNDEGGAVAPQPVPLVYTTRGNVPVSSLKLTPTWRVEDAFIQFTETYTDAEGVVVRQDVHVYDRNGITASGLAANF